MSEAIVTTTSKGNKERHRRLVLDGAVSDCGCPPHKGCDARRTRKPKPDRYKNHRRKAR